jgi:hypothetical protein
MQARSRWTALILFALAGSALTGCGKSNPVASTGAGSRAMDQAQVTETLARTAPVIDDGLMESADQVALSSASPAGSFALIHPLHYWRHITHVDRTFEFAFSDTDSTGRPRRADVTVRKLLAGTFNILFDATPGDSNLFDSLAVVHKPLHDRWERHILLRRIPQNHHEGDSVMHDSTGEGEDENEDEWKVAAVSGVDMRSYDPDSSSPGNLAFGNTEIVSVRIQSASGDTTINDPLKYFFLRRIPAFNPGENVTLTATTKSNTDVLVLMRSGWRRRFHNNGDNTYTIFWTTSLEDGVHHFAINALSNGTLFDDSAAYDSDAWIFPYRIRPTELADFMP